MNILKLLTHHSLVFWNLFNVYYNFMLREIFSNIPLLFWVPCSGHCEWYRASTLVCLKNLKKYIALWLLLNQSEFFLVTKRIVTGKVSQQGELAHVTYGLLVSQMQLIIREKYNCSSHYTELHECQKKRGLFLFSSNHSYFF